VETDSARASATDPGWEVLARVATGDGNAFVHLVESHQDRLLRLCERLLGDAEEARDAVQDIFLKVYRKAGEVRPQGQVYTWLYRVASNHCLDYLRKNRPTHVSLDRPLSDDSEMTFEDTLGGWDQVTRTHFAEGGILDKVMAQH